jgi:hypothetical protein
MFVTMLLIANSQCPLFTCWGDLECVCVCACACACACIWPPYPKKVCLRHNTAINAAVNTWIVSWTYLEFIHLCFNVYGWLIVLP